MRTLTVGEAKTRLGKLIEEVHNGPPVLLIHKNKLVKLERFDVFDPEYDSPELEAELLKAVEGPHVPYSRAEMRAIVARVSSEEKAASQKARAMSLALQRSPWFKEDFERQARWYARHASEGVPNAIWPRLTERLTFWSSLPPWGVCGDFATQFFADFVVSRRTAVQQTPDFLPL